MLERSKSFATTRRWLAVAAALFCVCGTTAAAQGTATVGTDDAIYLDLDRLVDAGLIDTVVVGQRPYSWAQIGRMVQQASRRADQDRTSPLAPRTREVIDRLTRRLAEGPWSALRASVTASALLTDAEARAVPDNGLGPIEADIRPLTDARQGRRYVTGANAALESSVSLDLSDNIAVQVRPRLWLYDPRDASTGAELELLAASARVRLGNAALTIGREYTEWSPGGGGGLFFSRNAPALDMIRLASDHPFVLPSLLRLLGPVSGTLQLADMGASVSNSHSRMVSYKVSVLPHPLLELGATFENHFGGAGARNPSAGNRIIDLLPFIDIFRKHHDATDFDSDKLLGVDGRLRLPALANVTLFGEVALEDFDHHRLRSVFTEDAAYSVGMIVPELMTPALSAQLRLHTLGIRFYQHHLVRDGIASRRVILGDDLSRDAGGATALLRWRPVEAFALTAEGALEERRNDRYEGGYVNPDSTGLVFRRVATAPREGRRRGLVGLQWSPPRGRLMAQVQAGVERTTNFTFVADDSRTRGVGTIALTAYY